MKLSQFFKENERTADVEFTTTNYTNSIQPDTLTFAVDEKNLNAAARNKNIKAIITHHKNRHYDFESSVLAFSKNPKRKFFEIHNHIYLNKIKKSRKHSISPKSKICKTAIIEHGVTIEDETIIESYAVIKTGSIVKKGAFVGEHAVVGARGLHDTFIDGERMWVWDAGGVIVQSGAQILSHATIQKPYFEEMTVIGENSIISLHVNIGHGCIVGSNTMIAGHAQLAGYVKVGNNVWIGPSACISHGIEIGNECEVLIGSCLISSIKDYQVVSGNFAINHNTNLKKHSLDLRKGKAREKRSEFKT